MSLAFSRNSQSALKSVGASRQFIKLKTIFTVGRYTVQVNDSNTERVRFKIATPDGNIIQRTCKRLQGFDLQCGCSTATVSVYQCYDNTVTISVEAPRSVSIKRADFHG